MFLFSFKNRHFIFLEVDVLFPNYLYLFGSLVYCLHQIHMYPMNFHLCRCLRNLCLILSRFHPFHAQIQIYFRCSFLSSVFKFSSFCPICFYMIFYLLVFFLLYAILCNLFYESYMYFYDDVFVLLVSVA